MKIQHTKQSSNSFVSITKKTPLAVMLISADTYTGNSVSDAATSLIYSEMLQSGAGELNRAAFLDRLNRIGASLEVNVAASTVTITVRSQAIHFPAVLKLLELMLTKPNWDTKELKRTKTQLLSELHNEQDNATARSQENLLSACYEQSDRRYEYPTSELTTAVKSIGVRQLVAKHDVLKRAYWTISAASSVENIVLAQKLFTKLKRASDKKTAANPTPLSTPHTRLKLTSIPSQQNIDFSIGAPLPITMYHKDFPALSMGLAILGNWGGFAGRLMSTVREKEGLTYGIYARAEGMHKEEPGLWRIWTFFAPERSVEGLQSTYRELQHLYDNGVTEQEVAMMKTFLTTNITLAQDSLRSHLAKLHSFHIQGMGPAEMKTFHDRYLTLDAYDVSTAIKLYLDPKHTVIGAAGPINAVEADLKKFAKVTFG